ncbi:DUF4239 domain-containing protein [Longispora albida]|uniref:bestrophin-like domain n=1 Tax=Longispora albida TaxID=203523 RepID=UPI00036F11B3|nr:DUF4239 domain-containing protein [Longispora albida]
MQHFAWIIAVLVACFLACTAMLALLRHRRRRRDTDSHNEASAAFMGVAGTFAAIILAFVIILEYEALSSAEQQTSTEASQLLELYWAAHALPPASGTPLKEAVLRYGELVVGVEWPRMVDGKVDATEGWAAVTRIRLAVENIQPADARQATFLASAQQATADLVAARQARLALVNATVSPIIWLVLITSCAATVSCGFLFRTERLSSHVVMMGSIIVVIVLNLLVVYELDHPFSRGIAVSPASISDALDHIRRLG